MISTGPAILQPMYKSMICSITNFMPYVKNLTLTSCEMLMKILELFLNRVKKNEDYYNCVASIIDTINYSLWYQDGHNENMRIAVSIR